MSDDTWEAHGPDEFGDFAISSKGEKLAKCVVVQNGFRTPEETAAIAARLVKAVNGHDALVKALVKALTAMLDQFGGYCGAPGCDEAIAVMQTLGLDRWSMQSQMERSAINANVPQLNCNVGLQRGPGE